MKKFKFAIQVTVIILALPVWFYAEMNHGNKKQPLKTYPTDSIPAETHYTKNGKDKTPDKLMILPGMLYTSLITLMN